MNVIVWIAQSFLALFFFLVGLPKLAGRGIDRWTGFEVVPRPLTVLIGAVEIAAAVALIVPMVVGVAEWTTPLAAIGVTVISLQACGFHLRAAERLPALETALWAALAGTIAIGRWGELSGGPSVPDGVLAPVLVVLVAAIVVILVRLFSGPAAAHDGADDRSGVGAVSR